MGGERVKFSYFWLFAKLGGGWFGPLSALSWALPIEEVRDGCICYIPLAYLTVL